MEFQSRSDVLNLSTQPRVMMFLHNCVAVTMRTNRLLLASGAAITLLSTLPVTTTAFAAKRNRNLVENLLGNVLSKRRTELPPTDAERGAALLKKLDIQSNTEPKPFSAELQQLPTLLTASMPVRRCVNACLFLLAISVSLRSAD